MAYKKYNIISIFITMMWWAIKTKINTNHTHTRPKKNQRRENEWEIRNRLSFSPFYFAVLQSVNRKTIKYKNMIMMVFKFFFLFNRKTANNKMLKACNSFGTKGVREQHLLSCSRDCSTLWRVYELWKQIYKKKKNEKITESKIHQILFMCVFFGS